MRHLKSLFCHIEEVVNAKKNSSMLCISKIHPFSLGNYLGISLIIGNFVRIRVTSVYWAWLRLEWSHA